MISVYKVIDNSYYVSYGKKHYLKNLKVKYILTFDENDNIEYIVFGK